MPAFGVVPLKQLLWRAYNLEHDALGIYLEEGEEINDALLSKIDRCCHSLYFTNVYKNYAPMRVTCSPEALARLNPKCLCFMGVLDGLDDRIFKGCPALEYLWLGASRRDEKDEPQRLLNDAPNLLRCPLNYLGLQGYGLVARGRDLECMVARLEKKEGTDRIQVLY